MILILMPSISVAGPLLLGYVFGSLYKTGYAANRRRNILRLSGVACIGLFITVRLINQYGDPSHWATQRSAAFTFLSFINTTKQSPSLLFLLMTLGPVLILLSYTGQASSRFSAFFKVYGNVPYVYFIVHLTLLRLINIIVAVAMGLPLQSDGSPIVWQVQGFGLPLWAVYLIWLGVVSMLYYPCRWYGHYKKSHSHWWLPFA